LQFLHVADVHLGKRQYNSREREEDFYKAFKEVVGIALKERVDALVISGDLFDSPIPYHGLEPIKVAVTELKKLRENGIEIIMVPGEHDIPKRRSLPSIELVAEQTGAKLLRSVNKIDHVEVKGVTFYGVQAFNPVKESELKKFSSIFKALSGRASKNSVLVTHIGLCEAFPFQCLDSSYLPRGFAYYALGHIHKPGVRYLEDSPMVYPGSLEVVSREEIADIDNKGPVLVDASDGFSFEKIKIRVRPQVVLKIHEKMNDYQIKKMLNDIPQGAVVHLFLTPLTKHHYEKIASMLRNKVLLIRVEIKNKKEIEKEVPKAVPKEVSLLSVLEDIYGSGLGKELYELLMEAEGSPEEVLDALKRLYEKGTWNRIPRVS